MFTPKGQYFCFLPYGLNRNFQTSSKCFFLDSVDTIDPGFDYSTEHRTTDRNRQTEDIFPHEALGSPPYDGMLISRSAVGGLGFQCRYTQGQRYRLLREGARSFLRFPYAGYEGSPHDFPIMGDCGAFAYISLKKPPCSTQEIADFYDSCCFTHGVSPDHIILGKNKKWDDERRRPSDVSARAEFTLNAAKEFFLLTKSRGAAFVPIGAVQAWSPSSFARLSKKLVGFGYEYIGLGGLAGRPTQEIYEIAAEVRSAVPQHIKIHIFGFSKFRSIEKFQGLGITSFDSTSPLIRALKDGKDNYYAPDGNHYVAIRIPMLHEAKTKRKIQSGAIDQTAALALMERCFESLRSFDKGMANADEVLEALSKYESALKQGAGKHEMYKRTLLHMPWKKCPCRICSAAGVEVIIFSGINRNKRRGFHNLYVFYNKLKEIRSMKHLKFPCIKIQQSPGRIIYSFVADGKDIQKFAAISRIKRGDDGDLLGYQRPELADHIGDIRSYLEKSDSMLPNSIVVAFNKKLCFKEEKVMGEACSVGLLEIPIGDDEKHGLIVDGQQRAAALRTLSREAFPVSIIGFESSGAEEEREQFVLVNNTRPLPKSLVYELLPSISTSVPPKLKKRQRAYRMLESLSRDEKSPFYYRVKTMTSCHLPSANIKDLSVLKMIE
ncbi:MAG: tRNA-guanine transglycosylase DpdA, partial [Pseudomonadota bacterium]